MRIFKEEPEPRGRGIFLADERWTLEWDNIAEDEETAQRIRRDPENWIPPSLDISCGMDVLATLKEYTES